ncbi:2-oxoacid:acceptor oxidoreductase family protein [Natronogracilivirga saccharolytica]|uniref:2-oxoacid:acceptor oxidoreductase family protein n=1 Tax=Natronogracilivirga saccharolytica TaxID=2812953 RepID=A0A8J7S708_9BACT|nr:2-oxoacid:acceptor oxidoreductase family protein [Natronogracilivirga saccharolytica]
MDLKSSVDIRGHARGGQGMVTAFEILAKVCSYRYDLEVQAFPFFGVERTGAPIQAYLRVSPEPIQNRSYIYHPDLVVVFDEGLMDQQAITGGISENAVILINSDHPPEHFKIAGAHVCTVPATRISVANRLGSKSLPIVNAAMTGAVLKILGADIEQAEAIIAQEVPSKPDANVESARIAFGQVVMPGSFTIDDFARQLSKKNGDPAIETNGSATSLKTDSQSPGPVVPHWNKPMSLNKTGSWRVIAPKYTSIIPPCSNDCPAGTDVRKFLAQASEGKFEDAYRTIYSHNPFPAICGRVCPHFCQQNCNRINLDGEVNIGAIERFIGDQNRSFSHKKLPVTQKEKIAVIGSGPAGLTAALRLRTQGYAVTVFEAMPKAGGMMRSGIPLFRLPDDVLDREIRMIEEQGVEIVLNRKVTVDELAPDYPVIITAVGSHVGTDMNLGDDAEVIDGIAFLREIKFSQNGLPVSIRPSDETAIVGGGNTAIDVARTALRLGARPTIYYRRTRNEMPAIAHEVEEAIREGVAIEFLTAPTGLKKRTDGRLEMTYQRMKLGEPDQSGRRRPVPVEGSETTVVIDHIVKAIGQRFDGHAFAGRQVKPAQGRLLFDDDDPGTALFCAGDMAWGGTVAEAIGSGNDAADEVMAWLAGQNWKKQKNGTRIATPDDINFAYYLPTPGNPTPAERPENLFGDFREVARGLSKETAVAEAGRCLHCGDCFNCGNCLNYCPDAAIFIDEENRLRIDYDYCKGCGICIRECPCSAIDYDLTSEGG